MLLRVASWVKVVLTDLKLAGDRMIELVALIDNVTGVPIVRVEGLVTVTKDVMVEVEVLSSSSAVVVLVVAVEMTTVLVDIEVEVVVSVEVVNVKMEKVVVLVVVDVRIEVLVPGTVVIEVEILVNAVEVTRVEGTVKERVMEMITEMVDVVGRKIILLLVSITFTVVVSVRTLVIKAV